MAKNDFSTYSVEELRAIVEQADNDILDGCAVIGAEESSWMTTPLSTSPGKTSVHLRVDSDVLHWFRGQGKGHLTRMNAVLRAYMQANRRRSQ